MQFYFIFLRLPLTHEQCPCHDEVEGCGELDVLAVALDEMYGMAERLDHRGIVGEGFAERLLIGTAEERGAEGLGSLHEAIGIATDRLATLGEEMTDGLYHRDDGHHGSVGGSLLIAATDDLVRHEGAHTVVHGHQSIGLIDQSQAIPYGMKARGATIGYTVGHTEAILAT